MFHKSIACAALCRCSASKQTNVRLCEIVCLRKTVCCFVTLNASHSSERHRARLSVCDATDDVAFCYRRQQIEYLSVVYMCRSCGFTERNVGDVIYDPEMNNKRRRRRRKTSAIFQDDAAAPPRRNFACVMCHN